MKRSCGKKKGSDYGDRFVHSCRDPVGIAALSTRHEDHPRRLRKMEEPTKVSLLDAIGRAKARLYGRSLKRTSADDQHIRQWVRYACERNEVPELAQMIVVEFNRRFTRRMGDGLYSPARMVGRIRLSIPLWERASEQDRKETVIHEACHIIAFYKDGNSAPHGSLWQQAMLNCGVEPLRTHAVDRTGLVRRQRLFVLCDCPKEEKCRIGVRHFNLLRRGAVLSCKICGLDLDRNASIEEERTATLQICNARTIPPTATRRLTD